MPDEPTCANPILLQFIKEWMDTARERNSKGYQTYRKAYDSLKAHPDVLTHPCESIKLRNIGEKLSSRLTTEYQKHCETHNIPMPEVPRGKSRKRPASTSVANTEVGEDDDNPANLPAPPPKRPRKQKPYVPTYRSGPYALLLTLYEEQLVRGGSPVGGIMTKQQLIDAAQKYCDSSFTAPSDPGKCYTAWAGMKVLTGKDLVWERGNPRKYSLSDAGEEVARGIMKVQKIRDGEGQGGEAEEEEEEEDREHCREDVSKSKEKGKGKNKINDKEKGKGKGKGKDDKDSTVTVFKATIKKKRKTTDTVASVIAEPSATTAQETRPLKESEFDTTIVLDDDEWFELIDKPANSRLQVPQQDLNQALAADMFDEFDFRLPTRTSPPASRASGSNSATTTTINNENDNEKLRRLRLEAIDRRLSGFTIPPPPSSSPPPISQPPKPKAAKNSNFLDLTLSSSPSPPPISPPRPLKPRDINPSQPADKQIARKPLFRAISQQIASAPAPGPRKPLKKSASAVDPPRLPPTQDKSTAPNSIPELAQSTGPGLARPATTNTTASSSITTGDAVTFPPFTPTPWPPSTFTIHLVLDSREVRTKSDRTYLQTELQSRGVIPITRPLHIGDALWIARHSETGMELVLDYVIERKRMDDLVGSIKDGRFHEQKWRLKRSGVRNIIYLIEDLGSWVPGADDASGGGSGGASAAAGYSMREAISTAISSTQVVNGFFLKRTSKLDDTIRYLARMHAHLEKLYTSKTIFPIPSHLLSSNTYFLHLLPHLANSYPIDPDPSPASSASNIPSKPTTLSFWYPEFTSFNEMVDKSAQLTHRDVFLKMLMCVRGVSAEKAIEIQKVWKTPREFVKAFEECGGGGARGGIGEARKEMVMNGVGVGGGIGRKRIGKALSAKICEVWWGEG